MLLVAIDKDILQVIRGGERDGPDSLPGFHEHFGVSVSPVTDDTRKLPGTTDGVSLSRILTGCSTASLVMPEFRPQFPRG